MSPQWRSRLTATFDSFVYLVVLVVCLGIGLTIFEAEDLEIGVRLGLGLLVAGVFSYLRARFSLWLEQQTKPKP